MSKIETIIRELKEEIDYNISKIGDIPIYLIPKVNESNDYAYPYVDVGNDGIIYIVIREKGIEYERNFCIDKSDAMFKLFRYVTYELAMEKEKKELDFSLNRVKERQLKLLKLLDENWNID